MAKNNEGTLAHRLLNERAVTSGGPATKTAKIIGRRLVKDQITQGTSFPNIKDPVKRGKEDSKILDTVNTGIEVGKVKDYYRKNK